MTTQDRAQDLLRQLTADPSAEFRDGQWEAIEALVDRNATVLVVQRTGWGKSAVYFIATRMLRDRGEGPTLLVSPLLALMRNQIEMARRAGVRAATINSGNQDDWEAIEAALLRGEIDLLLVSPERFDNERFRAEVMPAIMSRVGLLVVDEAHCISDWGHDFRPDYRRLSRVITQLRRVPVLCTTATANDRVIDDIVVQTGGALEIQRGPLGRESLRLSVLDLPRQADRLAWLATVIPGYTGSGIVYCLTVADTRRVARWLLSRGIDAVAYSGETDPVEREEIEQRLLGNQVKVVVATSALGMGFDKPDLAFVVHFQSPGSPIAYYQQVGRAGRGLDEAVAVLLRGGEDADIQDYFIRVAFPPQEDAEAVVAYLADQDVPTGIGSIEGAVNLRRSRLQMLLKILEVEGVVSKERSRWTRTLQPWTYPTERVERVTAQRRAEQQAMIDYANGDECRMAFLQAQLDDASAAPCGRCDRCTGTTPAVDLSPALVAEAQQHIRRSVLVIEPRRQGVVGVVGLAGRFGTDEICEPGRVLSIYGDGGWGGLVKRAKYAGEPLPDEVIDALVDLVRAWNPDPAPRWITAVPSTSSSVVDDVLERLGAALGLEVHRVVRRSRPGEPQKTMQNSAQQARNVAGAFSIDGSVPDGPVLLLDDVVDSRWTLTVVGRLLRQSGSGPVFPLALAQATSD